MKTIKFLNLKVKGFKKIKEEVEFNFKDKNIFEGRNEAGKTTIAEAISWVLFGSDLFGSVKTADRLINDSSKKAEVSLRLSIDDKEYTIQRIKAKNFAICVNGKITTQPEIEFILGMDNKLFLSMYNPMYFSNLEVATQKEIITNLVNVSDQDIVNSLNDYNKEKIKEFNIANAKIIIEELEQDIKDNQKEIIQNEGRLQQISIICEKEIPDKCVFEKEEELNKTEQEFISAQSLSSENSIRLKEKEIGFIETKIRDLESSLKKESFLYEKERNILKEKYLNTKKNLNNNNNLCPQCGQKLPEEIYKKNIDEKRKELTLIETEGIDKKNTFIGLKEKIDNDIEKLKTEKENLLKEIEILKTNKNPNNLEEIKSKLQDLKKRKKETEMKNIERDILIQQKKNAELEKEKIQNRIQQIESIISEIKIQVSILKSIETKKMDIFKKMIKENTKRLKIELEQVNKTTGEIRGCFKLKFDDRNIKTASYSGEIKLGLEIGDLLRNLLSIDCPVFIDNVDVISEYETIASQIFVAKVNPNSDLKII